MPGPSLYRLCPIFTIECHVGSMLDADGNSRTTCSRTCHQAQAELTCQAAIRLTEWMLDYMFQMPLTVRWLALTRLCQHRH